MYLDAPVRGAELFVDNGELVALIPPDAERFGRGWRFHWRQLLGPKVQLDSCRSKRPRFDAPGEGATKLLFEVTIENAEDDEVVTDTVLVFVGASVQQPAAALPHGDGDGGSAVQGPRREADDEVDVGEPIADTELHEWTDQAEPLSLGTLMGHGELPGVGAERVGRPTVGSRAEVETPTSMLTRVLSGLRDFMDRLL